MRKWAGDCRDLLTRSTSSMQWAYTCHSTQARQVQVNGLSAGPIRRVLVPLLIHTYCTYIALPFKIVMRPSYCGYVPSFSSVYRRAYFSTGSVRESGDKSPPLFLCTFGTVPSSTSYALCDPESFCLDLLPTVSIFPKEPRLSSISVQGPAH